MQINQISEEQIKSSEFIAVRSGGEVECLVSFDAQDASEPYSVCESVKNGLPRMEFFASLSSAQAYAQEIGWGQDEFSAL